MQHDASSIDDSSTAARIRNNQRRSSARHREFVDGLKAKVREYERQGVQATLEMRQAARQVALENWRLRSLLASRGVTHEEIDRYLLAFSPNHPSTGQAHHTQPRVTGSPPPLVSDVDVGWPPRADHDAPNRASRTSAMDAPAMAASDASTRQVLEHVAAAPSRPDPCPPPGPGLNSNHAAATSASHLEMLCTAAAVIMADV